MRPTHWNIAAAALTAGVVSTASVVLLPRVERPAHAGQAAVESPTIAVFDLYGVLETALQAPTAVTERETTAGIFREQATTLQTQLQDLGTQIQSMGVQSPEAQPLIGEYQQKQQQLQQVQGQIQQTLTQLYADQMATAYSNIIDTANAIADEAGYDILLGSRPATSTIDRGPVEVMVQELLARPVLRAPGSIDITDRVRERLDLPEQAEDQSEPADDLGDMVAPEAP